MTFPPRAKNAVKSGTLTCSAELLALWYLLRESELGLTSMPPGFRSTPSWMVEAFKVFQSQFVSLDPHYITSQSGSQIETLTLTQSTCNSAPQTAKDSESTLHLSLTVVPRRDSMGLRGDSGLRRRKWYTACGRFQVDPGSGMWRDHGRAGKRGVRDGSLKRSFSLGIL